MDVALVEHPQHDVDDEDRRREQERHRGERGPERLGRALERAVQRRRRAQSLRHRASIAVTAWPSDTPGVRLNDSVTAGKKPWWLIVSGSRRST